MHSSGPTSPQGRVRSSINALRHGLTARVVVLPTEDMAAYKDPGSFFGLGLRFRGQVEDGDTQSDYIRAGP
jgi:hypothetical protein